MSEMPPAIFVPHGTRCEADDGRPDFGRCDEPASAMVQADGRDRYVCHQHYLWWVRDHPQVEA